VSLIEDDSDSQPGETDSEDAANVQDESYDSDSARIASIKSESSQLSNNSFVANNTRITSVPVNGAVMIIDPTTVAAAAAAAACAGDLTVEPTCEHGKQKSKCKECEGLSILRNLFAKAQN
jgi:hypothetical protein